MKTIVWKPLNDKNHQASSQKFRQQTPEEGQRIYRPKCCGNNIKDEDNSLKTLNDKKHFKYSLIILILTICNFDSVSKEFNVIIDVLLIGLKIALHIFFFLKVSWRKFYHEWDFSVTVSDFFPFFILSSTMLVGLRICWLYPLH